MRRNRMEREKFLWSSFLFQRKIVGQIVLATILLVLLTGSASAEHACVADDGSGDAYYCGDTVTKSCMLNGSMNCPAGHGLVIGAGDIIIDGDGYALNGTIPDECTGATKYRGTYSTLHDNVTIKDMEVKNFCVGIWLAGDGGDEVKANGSTIDNCKVHDNGQNVATRKTHGIVLSWTDNTTIKNCEIYNNTGGEDCTPVCENGGNGIFMYTGNHNEITKNHLYNNRKCGFFTKAKPRYANITNNTLWGNGQGGIVLRCKACEHNLIEHNNASDNYGTGIFIGGPRNTIRNNIASYNKDGAITSLPGTLCGGCGINLGRSDGSYENELYNNTVCGNEYLDMYVCAECYGNHGDCNTCDTASNYCDGSAACPPPCVYQCEGEGADLKIIDDDIEFATWIVEGVNYTINYTVTNIEVDPAGACDAGVYINDAWVQNDSVPALTASASYTSTIGPFSVTGPNGIDTVKVCADDNHVVMESDEDNNCGEDTFCGPNLQITAFWREWVDLSWKWYNLSYTVENAGQIATPHECWTNLTELSYGEWTDVVDPVPVPVLDVGESVTHTVGPFVMGDSSDICVQVFADYNHTIPENHEDVLHGNYDRFMPDYTEPYTGQCLGCGDVDCSGDVRVYDTTVLKLYVGEVPRWIPDCYWAGDVNGDGDVRVYDTTVLKLYVGEVPGWGLSCRTGCYLGP